MNPAPDSASTLVLHTGGIGDFILACPAIAWLARAGPVALLGRKERLALAVEAGIAAAAHALDDVDFSTIFATPSPRLRSFLAPFTRACIWMRDEDGHLETALHALGISQVQCWPGLPPEHWPGHAAQYYQHCVRAPEALPQEAFLPLPPAGEALDVVLHPGSGSQKKNWPLDRFLELAEALAAAGRQVHCCAGPAEEALAFPPGTHVLREPGLPALGARLATAQLFIGNDSGISHLAAAVGCPTLAVFGPTDPVRWRPLGTHVRVLQGTPWPDVRAVLDAAALVTGR